MPMEPFNLLGDILDMVQRDLTPDPLMSYLKGSWSNPPAFPVTKMGWPQPTAPQYDLRSLHFTKPISHTNRTTHSHHYSPAIDDVFARVLSKGLNRS